MIAESSVTTEGKDKSTAGHQGLESQMSVVAMTANVKVLILEKEEIALFPEDVQREIVNGLRLSKNIE